jgi:hypothetical protein
MKEYNSRKERTIYLSRKFSDYLSGSVLNVGGGGNKTLSQYINASKYMEIDISGSPDICLNLDKDYPIPCEDSSFDTVICCDVLEHLEEFHRTFDELIRISNKYIIISLPNGLVASYSYLLRKKVFDVNNGQGKYSKFYGLPFEKPLDRHRWYFSYSDISEFINHKKTKLKYEVVNEFPVGDLTNNFKGKIIYYFVKLLFGKSAAIDCCYSTYWCLIKVK